MTIYDLAIKDRPWRKVVQYPLALLFLIDFRLNWERSSMKLRGDSSMNISDGLARLSGIVGGIMRWFK